MKQNVVTIDTNHTKLLKWVEDIKKLCQPDKIQWYYGSENEFKLLCNQLVENGTLIPLSQKYRPNSYLARTDPRDVSRASRHTYICSKVKSDIGLGKNWIHPDEMEILINKLFDGCMKGRTMYIVPFCMGPLKSPFSRFGVEITDSPFVVVSLHLIARVGNEVLKELGENKWFLPCLHSVGFPLETGQKDVPWPCNPDNTHVVLFTEELSIISYGSNFGGNSFLSHRYFGIQIASILAKKEGWFAEHALILSLISPEGKKILCCCCFS
jgi:phosphoenolpyruvate carboxykinase (GTP)